MTRAVLATLVVVLAVACSELPINPRDVPGTYVMNRGRAADTLIVLPQGRYRRVYAMPGQPVVIDSGTWSIGRSGHQMVVKFGALSPRWETETEASARRRSPPLASASWSTEPTRTLSGKMKLWVDEFLDWAYIWRGGAR